QRCARHVLRSRLLLAERVRDGRRSAGPPWRWGRGADEGAVKVPITPLDFLERARRLFGPLEAAVDGDRRVTYSEFADRAHRLAYALRSDLVCRLLLEKKYLCGNTLELLEAYYGVILTGCILTPLNIRLSVA